MSNAISTTRSRPPRILVVGVGRGGINSINRMIDDRLPHVEFIAIDTDRGALAKARSNVNLQLGKQLTGGAAARSAIGRTAIEAGRLEVARALAGADLLIVTCGMGGGTGTGAAPIVAQLGKETGALTIGIATTPFQFEGATRMHRAEAGIAELERYADGTVIVPNENGLSMVTDSRTLQGHFSWVDEVILIATRGISTLLTDGAGGVGLPDLRTILGNQGSARMGTGIGKGPDRALQAARAAVSSPLLDGVSLSGAEGMVIHISGGEIARDEITPIGELVRAATGDRTEIIFGCTIDKELGAALRVTVIAVFDHLSRNGPHGLPHVMSQTA